MSMTITELIVPNDKAIISVESKLQRQFFYEDTEKGTLALGKIIQSQNSPEFNHSHSVPIHFEWNSSSTDNEIEVSKDSNFLESRKYNTENHSIDIFNFETGCTYYWRVNGSEARSFETKYSKPRYIRLDGVKNIRDAGSWKTKDGTRIKQGMIYRGFKLENHITEAGSEEFHKLGIKTELDLREESIGKLYASPAGEDINYIQIPCKAYEEFFYPEEKKYCKQIFELLADESAYPIYFHCAGGADRTGTVAFLLGSILGVDERTLIRDYEITMIANKDDLPDMRRTRWGELFKRFIKEMNSGKYGKGTLCDKSIKSLESCGVTQETMEKIRKILLDK